MRGNPVVRDPARLFAVPTAVNVPLPDGSSVLRSREALADYPRSLGVYLDNWAAVAPDRPFILERDSSKQWKGLCYRELRVRVRSVATGLLELGLNQQRAVAILSDNAVEHAVLMLAGLYVGIPVVSISAAYSLLSSDFSKLRHIISVVEPGLIYAAQRERYARVTQALEGLHRAHILFGDEFSALEVKEDRSAVDAACARVGYDTVAKLLFTSGSTGKPKAVINTQRMLVSNQQARAQTWPFLETTPPVLLDWLPWSHTFGGNHNFNLVLRFGGTLYIDGGRPVPGLFPVTVENLRDVAPTVYFNVPRGYDMLVNELEADAKLRKRFFSRLQVLFYAAAALPQNLWGALLDLSIRAVGEPVPLVSAWGATETGPMVTDCHYQADRAGVIGVPIPGVEVKLVSNGQKCEARVRGPNIMPGYLKEAGLTRAQFDCDGFYRTGDAVRLVDSDRPEKGLLFDGRLAEDFKLDTGTWVNAGTLRSKALAALAPIAQDLVVAGQDRPWVAFLIFPNVEACRRLCGASGADLNVREVLEHPSVREHVVARLSRLRAEGGGSSTYATAALMLDEPPSLDAGEITDKGYINQRAVLDLRGHLVERLYEGSASDVMRLK
jgi:feruloyl-CoA synthase